ncbi:MAG: hypothetical protein GC134_04170 [Proteobacteria bacterium]|nr:hypothetical protein [Pseudomonadota bacterium]
MRPKVLMNAESFGFGPTAAIASFFPYLRPHVPTLGYIGEGHSLDLQTPLPYNDLHDCTNWSDSAILRVMRQYDVFVTATDFRMAALAKQAGLFTVIYDPLTWFWREMPDAVKACDMYLAQNFIGVADALAGYLPHMRAQAHTVAPILQKAVPLHKGDTVLINFGGLLNPFWSLADAVSYARSMYRAIKATLPVDVTPVVCASTAIAKALPEMNAKSYARADMLTLMAQSKLAFMTSGLGNIYDAAQYDLPTVWLPPTNDSQGQQLALLVNAGLTDQHIDWQHIDGSLAVDYHAPQAEVMAHIVRRVHGLAAPAARTAVAHAYAQVNALGHSKTRGLIQRFGTGGAEEVAGHILNILESKAAA